MISAMRVRTVWRVVGIVLVLAVVYLSLARLAQAPPVDGGDKIGHLLAYGTLMFWHAALVRSTRGRLVTALGLITLGISLEFAQGLTDYRSFELVDMLANTLGVIIGWTVAPPRGPDLLARLETRTRG